jgi:adenylate kinase
MIFVCGVSGTGKSHVTSLVTDSDARFVHVKGSQILAECGRPIRDLNFARAQENQSVLRHELLSRNLISDRHILDGHMTIETQEGFFVVPDSFFEAISVQRIICIFDDPTFIARRLEQKGLPASPIAVDAHQKFERKIARRRAGLLACPYHEFAASNLEQFARALES